MVTESQVSSCYLYCKVCKEKKNLELCLMPYFVPWASFMGNLRTEAEVSDIDR